MPRRKKKTGNTLSSGVPVDNAEAKAVAQRKKGIKGAYAGKNEEIKMEGY
ncbi:MAG: hypothetical protein H0Z39_09070 [Peptococcaceae bacterium]|nr:hypothetical protein [Peptococcaceae bacterium]